MYSLCFIQLSKWKYGFYDDSAVTSGGVLTDVTADLNAGTNSAAFGFNVLWKQVIYLKFNIIIFINLIYIYIYYMI